MLAMPHHVSLSQIVVGGSFACAVFFIIASSLAQAALGASEIVLASPGEILSAGLTLKFTVARVGAFSVINASAPPPDDAAMCIRTILSPPLSILIAPAAGAFHLSCSPPHFGSSSVAQPFISSSAGRYSDDRDVLRFAMFLCVLMTVSILSSYRNIQRWLFISVLIGPRLAFMKTQNQLTNVALALFVTFLIKTKFLTCSVWPARPSMRSVWLMPKMKSLKSWMACLVFASIIFISPLCVKGGLPVSSPQLTKPLHNSHFHCSDLQTHSCAILNGGAVKCWGKVYNSNQGYSTISTPVEVQGLSSGVGSLALGRVRFFS